MKISLLQTDIRWKDPRANRRRAEELISDLPAADLIVLPEMFTTGFCTDPTETAEPADSETLAWMRSVAGARNAAVGGSVATEADGRYYNRFYFVKPDGSNATYDKRHLFSFAGETRAIPPVRNVSLWSIAGSASCCRCVTTCVFRFSPATGAITT